MSAGSKRQKQLHRLVEAATRLEGAGQYQAAVEAAVRALEIDGDCLPAYRLVARVQARHRNLEPALWAAGEALRCAPEAPDVLLDAAKVERIAGHLEDALSHAEAAVARDRQLPGAGGLVLHLLTMLRREDEVLARLDAALAEWPDDVGVALVFAGVAPRTGRAAEATRHLERLRRSVVADAGATRDLLFALGALYEGAGDADSAFEAFSEAHARWPLRWDPDAYDRAVADLCANWSEDFLRRAPRASVQAGNLVFIVGMPRSGTSLVEQILAAHPQVAAGGELPHLAAAAHAASPEPGDLIPFRRNTFALDDARVADIGRSYLEATAPLAGSAARFTDKMPANHALLGLVELALPGARIVHCRRDPRDTCLSCWTTPLWESLQYVGDLRHLGRYALAEQRLMAHWKARLSAPIHTVDYEALVAEPEREARALVEFAGLPWDDACLRFHEARRFVDTASALQVRRPVYTSSVGRWRLYEQRLGALFEALGG